MKISDKHRRHKLQLEQLDKKMKLFSKVASVGVPSEGWIYAIRTSLGMSLGNLAERKGITAQSIKELEQREKNRSITLKNLAEIAEVFNLRLVYGFVPQADSLTEQFYKQARQAATKIILRADKTMRLENQGNSTGRLKKAIQEKTEDFKNEPPRCLWD